MDDRDQNGTAMPGRPDPDNSGGPADASNGAPTGWSAPEGYWGASSTPPAGTRSPQSTGQPLQQWSGDDAEWAQSTLHERSDRTTTPRSSAGGAPGGRNVASAQPASLSAATDQRGARQTPPTQQNPDTAQNPYGGAPGPQGNQPPADWDTFYSSFGNGDSGGGYPGGPGNGNSGSGGAPRRRNGAARRAISVILGLVVLIAAAATLVPRAEQSGLWPITSSSSPSTAQGGTDQNDSPDPGDENPNSGQAGTGQASSQAQTDATTEQSKGVVLITTTTTSGSAAGTGMVLNSDGYVLTNYHVVESSTAIKVTVASTNKSYSATMIGHDATNDVALLKINQVSGLSTVAIDKDGVKLGQQVTSVGNSQGQGFLSAAGGSVTSTSATVTVSSELASSGSETLRDVYQTTVQAVPGDSGGPMYDAENEVIGITTAGEQSDSGTQGRSSTVASWAIPIARALTIVDQIESGKTSGTVQVGPRAYLGVTVQTSRGTGLVITQVVSGGPADEAGLEVGDAILSINGQRVDSQSDLSDVLNQLSPGAQSTLTVMDSTGSTSTVTVTLGSSPIN